MQASRGPLERSPAGDDRRNRLRQNGDVQPDRPVLEVVEVEPDEVVEAFAWIERDPTVYHTMNGPSEFHVIGSIRDWQRKSGGQFTLGKNFDGTGGFGPEVVTPDELPPGAAPLRIMTRVNGEVMQDSNTDDLIFDVPTLVHELSKVMTLEPGDIIITGTPSGVALARDPQPWLKPGDVCEVEIEKIGVLRNPIVQGA